MIAALSIVMLICIVLRARQKPARNDTALTNGSTFSTSCIYYCTTEAIEIKGTAPSVCTLRKLIMVYEYACHGVWSYTTREGVWLSQQIHC